MTAKELAEEILADIAAGRLNPNAILVRPLCMCDQDVGYVEAAHLDQVVRRWNAVQTDGSRVYRYGDVEPAVDTALTLKLG